MASQQSHKARELVSDALRGETSRRDFIARGIALGLSGTLINSVVALDVVAAGQTPVPEATPVDDLPIFTDDLSYSVNGLEGPAQILVDQWGVPHIYATTFNDAFFVQGFNAARDRLWQIDIWRRKGVGELSAVFGESFVDQDRASRLFLYRGDMFREWLAYSSDTKDIVTAFVNGINSYIDLITDDPSLLPMEFSELDYLPSRWEPEDVVRLRSHGLTRNLSSEVARSLILRDYGEVAESLRKLLQPDWDTEIPEGLDLELIPDDVLNVYQLATQGVTFQPPSAERATKSRLAGLIQDLYDGADIGSNNWVVAPERTNTGRPILANDPHRSQSVPSLRYMTHIEGPGISIIGAGEPGLPGISIGHNGTIAFGLTVFAIDSEDLYIYEINPDNPDEYKYEGRWVPMDIVTETIDVRDGAPTDVTLRFTQHGPVIYEDNAQNSAFAVRSAWFEPGTAAYLASLSYIRAQNWREFLSAMNRWESPAENQVYADTAGNIGWKPGGLAPIRPNWDGLLPVPGDGRYEWDGFLPMDELPVIENPDQGWAATANEMNLPDDYPYEAKKLGFEWSAPYRYQRIKEVLDANDNVTVDDMLALQTDHLSIPARNVIALLGNLSSNDDDVSAALSLLTEWDYIESIDSGAAALWEVWWNRHLRPAVVSHLLPPEAAEEIGGGDAQAILGLLENPSNDFGDDPAAARDEILLTSLGGAVQEVQELLGPEMDEWKWGDLHYAQMDHAMSEMVSDSLRSQLDVGPLPRGGSGDTVGNTGYRLSDFRQTAGSSFRMVLDVGNWDSSLAMNTPGQSGNPSSPHYRDLFEMWVNDEAFPLLFNRTLIEESVQQRISLNGDGEM